MQQTDNSQNVTLYTHQVNILLQPLETLLAKMSIVPKIIVVRNARFNEMLLNQLNSNERDEPVVAIKPVVAIDPVERIERPQPITKRRSTNIHYARAPMNIAPQALLPCRNIPFGPTGAKRRKSTSVIPNAIIA